MVTYTPIREIGRGGFGIVELVEDESGKQYACKTLMVPPGMSKSDMQSRFDREVKYQKAIDHRNIVPVLNQRLDDDPPWFIMPLAVTSLRNELEADRTLSGAPRKALFDILVGVEEIHRKGYKHRDLSPNNVLKFVTDAGEAYYAVSDFGLIAPASGTTTTLTETNVAGGTLMYRAPECATDFKRASFAADIYSIGAILYDIFGGGVVRIPHTELTTGGMIGDIIARCTKSNPRRRYKSIAELREALYDLFDTTEIVFQSDAEKHVIELLAANDTLTNEQWDGFLACIDRLNAACGSLKNLLSSIRIVHINDLLQNAPDLFSALGSDYAALMMNESFDFEFCDVIGAIAQVFYDNGDLGLQAEIALGALELGATHNRWSVERRFVSMASPKINAELADRILVEVDVRSFPFKLRFEHVCHSISVSAQQIHDALRTLLAD
jgi:serine/threonine protein kinase